MEREEDAFAILVRMLNDFELRIHYTRSLEGLHVRLSQFECLLYDLEPELTEHMRSEDINGSMYATQWFMTLFAYRLPMPIVLRIYDLFFAHGIPILLSVALALVRRSSQELLSLKFDSLLDFLKGDIFTPFLEDENSLVRAAYEIKVDSIPRANALPRRSTVASINYDHRRQISALERRNYNLEDRVRALEDELTELNREHISLANELLQIKLERDTNTTNSSKGGSKAGKDKIYEDLGLFDAHKYTSSSSVTTIRSENLNQENTWQKVYPPDEVESEKSGNSLRSRLFSNPFSVTKQQRQPTLVTSPLQSPRSEMAEMARKKKQKHIERFFYLILIGLTHVLTCTHVNNMKNILDCIERGERNDDASIGGIAKATCKDR
jgi:Rab-GTPase-TBC domain